MPGHQGVDPLDHRQRNAGVLHAFRPGGRADAGVAERHDDVGALLLHLRNEGARRRHDVADADVALEVAPVPRHDLGRDETDQADADRMGFPRTVGQRAVQDDVGRHQRLVLRRIGTKRLGDVGRDHRELRPGQRFHQEVEPVVELVVAKGRCVEADRVHRGDDGVHVAVLHAPFVGDIVAHRVALQEVAVVDQHRVRRLGADRPDDGRRARQADSVHRPVGIVVVGEDVHVQVGGFHDAQVRLARLCSGREGMQCDQGCPRQTSGEEGPPPDRVFRPAVHGDLRCQCSAKEGYHRNNSTLSRRSRRHQTTGGCAFAPRAAVAQGQRPHRLRLGAAHVRVRSGAGRQTCATQRR